MDISEQARAALADGRVIDAIKQVREDTGLGLKEAKDLVDIYRAANPSLCPPAKEISVGQKTLLFLVLGAGAIALGYWFLVRA